MRNSLTCALTITICSSALFADNLTWSASGSDALSITNTVDNFREIVSLGGANNAPGSGPFLTGRREINWDAGGLDSFQSPGFMPGDFFNNNSPRGAVVSTPGDGLVVSQRNPANDSDLRFGDINASFANDFQVFSETRLFAALGSTVIDTTFFVASDPTIAATVNGFGAIFTDVDIAGLSSIEFYDINDSLIHTQDVLTASGGLSFAAAFWDDGTRISRVRLNLGDTPLDSYAGIGDAVALDDFIYGEPIAVPTPGVFTLFAASGCMISVRRRRS